MVCADMAVFLLGEYIVNLKEYTSLFHIAEFGVDCSAEITHCGGESDICVHQRRDVAPFFTHGMIESAVILFEIVALEEILNLGGVGIGMKWMYGSDEPVRVREITMDESE